MKINRNKAFLVCLIAISITTADCKVFSATLNWQRIGATPQFLTKGTSGSACGSSFNSDPSNGCTTYSVRTILFRVEAVFEASAFSTTPSIGTEIQTTQPCVFCSGEPGDPCYTAYLEVIDVVQNASLRSNVTLVYTQFQKLKVYPNAIIGNVTATFRTIARYSKCISSSTSRCLGPQNGIINNKDNFCTSCLDDVASQMLNLSSTVLFYDTAGSNAWDAKYFQNYRLFPATNHHSPYTTFHPLVTIPSLADTSVLFDLQIPAVDEDGADEPLACRDPDPSVPCSSVDFVWDMKTLIGSEGLSLNFHSDGVQSPGGGWLLTRRGSRW